jgi:hypothetical protein
VAYACERNRLYVTDRVEVLASQKLRRVKEVTGSEGNDVGVVLEDESVVKLDVDVDKEHVARYLWWRARVYQAY